MVKVVVPATSANLGPGFDTLGVALEMYNTIEMAETGILDDVIEIEGHGEALERPENNLVWLGAQKVFERLGWRPYGFLIREHIGVPVARGLGSSAAAIVGGLVGGNALYERMTGRTGLDREQLLEMAVQMEGHPDNVTPAMMGGFTTACVEEGRTLYVRFDPPPGLVAVVAIPEVQHLSAAKTKAARGVLPQEIKMADAVFNLSRATLLVAALLTGKLDLLSAATKDRWHQPYREHLVPGLRAVIQAALDAGARGVALSGAGPSVLALTDRNPEAVEFAMEAAFQWSGSDCRVRTVHLDRHGARIISP